MSGAAEARENEPRTASVASGIKMDLSRDFMVGCRFIDRVFDFVKNNRRNACWSNIFLGIPQERFFGEIPLSVDASGRWL